MLAFIFFISEFFYEFSNHIAVHVIYFPYKSRDLTTKMIKSAAVNYRAKLSTLAYVCVERAPHLILMHYGNTNHKSNPSWLH